MQTASLAAFLGFIYYLRQAELLQCPGLFLIDFTMDLKSHDLLLRIHT